MPFPLFSHHLLVLQPIVMGTGFRKAKQFFHGSLFYVRWNSSLSRNLKRRRAVCCISLAMYSASCVLKAIDDYSTLVISSIMASCSSLLVFSSAQVRTVTVGYVQTTVIGLVQPRAYWKSWLSHWMDFRNAGQNWHVERCPLSCGRCHCFRIGRNNH